MLDIAMLRITADRPKKRTNPEAPITVFLDDDTRKALAVALARVNDARRAIGEEPFTFARFTRHLLTLRMESLNPEEHATVAA